MSSDIIPGLSRHLRERSIQMKRFLKITLFFLAITFCMANQITSLPLQSSPREVAVESGERIVRPVTKTIEQEAHHKIIFMISPPRSLTSAFARMMQARGDFSVYDEPSVLAFNLLHAADRGTFFLDWFKPEAPKTYVEFKNIIFNDLKKTNVFIKEMTFSVKDFLTKDIEFIKDPRIHFVFLIRNPHDALISVYKKLPISQQNLGFALPVISYESCFQIYEHLKQHATHKPYIVLTEKLYSEPEKTIQDFSATMHIPFIPSSLKWESLGETFNGASWHEYKKEDQMYHWHDNAIRSTGFQKPNVYALDPHGVPTFQEITEPDGKILCMQIYKENMKFYKKFLAEVK